MERGLPMWTIYRDPSDYPGKHVVRRSVVRKGSVTFDPTPIAVADTLTGARAALPEGVVKIERAPDDDPVIVETWI